MQKDNSFRKEDILYGKHVSIMSAVGTLANQLDNILVYHLLGPASLALYSFSRGRACKDKARPGKQKAKEAEQPAASTEEKLRGQVFNLDSG